MFLWKKKKQIEVEPAQEVAEGRSEKAMAPLSFLDLRFRLSGFLTALSAIPTTLRPRAMSQLRPRVEEKKPTRREQSQKARKTMEAEATRDHGKKRKKRKKTLSPFPTSMSQSAQRLLSGSLSRARSIRSCLSLIETLAILVGQNERAAQGRSKNRERAESEGARRRRWARRRRRRRRVSRGSGSKSLCGTRKFESTSWLQTYSRRLPKVF